MQFFDPNNAFDAEGLTRLTQQTQRRSRERNEIEQDTPVAISQKNFEATQLKLEIERQKRFAELAQTAGCLGARSRAGGDGRQDAGRAASARRSRRRSTPSGRCGRRKSRKHRPCGSARSKPSAKCRSLQSSSSAPRRSPTRNKAISIAQKSEEQSQAEASANARARRSGEGRAGGHDRRGVAKAEREKEVDAGARRAGSRTAGDRRQGLGAEAEKDAAEAKAEAIRTLAEANRENYEVEAAGKRAMNEAINTLSSGRSAAGEARADPGAAEDHRGVGQADGEDRLHQHHAGRRAQRRRGRRTAATHAAVAPSGNLAEQAVGAALKYRAYAPVLDQLIKEVGLSGNGLNGLVKVAPAAASTNVPAVAEVSC